MKLEMMLCCRLKHANCTQMEGFVEKRSSGKLIRTWQKRYFRQEGLTLKYYAKETDLEPKQTIDLRDVIRVRAGPLKGKQEKNSR